jgi:hypothetical protein
MAAGPAGAAGERLVRGRRRRGCRGCRRGAPTARLRPVARGARGALGPDGRASSLARGSDRRHLVRAVAARVGLKGSAGAPSAYECGGALSTGFLDALRAWKRRPRIRLVINLATNIVREGVLRWWTDDTSRCPRPPLGGKRARSQRGSRRRGARDRN